MRVLLFALAAILFGGVAEAQAVQQSGSVTPGHAAMWLTNGVIGDAGTSQTPGLTTLGIQGTGTPFCITDNSISSPSGYRQLCFAANLNNGGGAVTYNAYGGAQALPFNLIINGTSIPIGGTGWLSALLDQQFGSIPGDILCRSTTAWSALAPGALGTVLSSNGTSSCPSWTTNTQGTGLGRIIASGATDTATPADQTIAWNSTTSSNKTENIPGCSASNPWQRLVIKDEAGTASTFYIAVVPASGTIDKITGTVYINFSFQALTLQCDGSSNWILE